MSEFDKKILQGGGPKPSEHDRVIVDVSMHLDGYTLFENLTVHFDLGHAEDFGVIKFIDDVVKTMGLNEKCQVFTKPNVLTQSELEHLKLAENSYKELHLELYLRDIQKLAGFWQMSESEKILIADIMKRRGNKLTKNGLLIRAYKTYKIAIQTLEGSVSVMNPTGHQNCSSPNSDEARSLLVTCLANAALCLLRLHEARHPNGHAKSNLSSSRAYLIPCLDHCRKAVELQPDYAKAWYRYAKTYAKLGDYQEATDKAEQCIQCLHKLHQSPNQNSDLSANQISLMLGQVQNSLREWRQKANQEAVDERTRIRQMTLKADRYTYNWYDDEDEVEKLPISVWSNELAENMMSLHEELEAFGETMPEYRASRKGKNKTKQTQLATIEDEDSDEV